MKTRRIFLAALVAGAGILTGCGGDKASETTERPAVPVRVEVAAPFDEDLVKTYTGALEGRNQAVIYAKIAEAVDSVLVHEGDKVSAGQVLVKLDKTGPSSQLSQSESTYRNAEKTYNKMKVLFEQGAVSESQYDDAETAYEVAQAAYQSARQLVEIQSPIAGTVTEVNVRRGDYLSQGQSVATVAATDRLRVRFDVKATDMGLVQVGDTVRVVAETVEEPLAGVVTAVAQSADPVSRAFEVEAVVANTGAAGYMPGMFVRVQLIMQRLSQVLGVPQDAVIALSEGPALYVVENGLARRRMVKLGPETGGRVVVEQGLQAGDTVVTLGQSYLDDSTAVRIINVEKGAS